MKFQKSQEIHRRIIQRQLKLRQKYLKKDIYHQKKDRKLLALQIIPSTLINTTGYVADQLFSFVFNNNPLSL